MKPAMAFMQPFPLSPKKEDRAMRYGIMLLLVLLAGILVLSGCGKNSTTYGELLSKRAKVSSYQEKFNMSYQETFNAPTLQKPQQKTIVMLIQMKKGNISKVKSEYPDGLMLIDFDKNNMYMGDTTTHTAYHTQMNNTGSDDFFTDMDFTGRLAAGIKKETVSKESEMVNGVKCWVFEQKPEEGSKGLRKHLYYLYIDDKYGLVRKVAEMPNSAPDPSAKGNLEAKTEELIFTYDRINQVKDSEFALPADMKVVSMEDMMKGMPNNSPPAH